MSDARALTLTEFLQAGYADDETLPGVTPPDAGLLAGWSVAGTVLVTT